MENSILGGEVSDLYPQGRGVKKRDDQCQSFCFFFFLKSSLREWFKKKSIMENSILGGGSVRVIFHIHFFLFFCSKCSKNDFWTKIGQVAKKLIIAFQGEGDVRGKSDKYHLFVLFFNPFLMYKLKYPHPNEGT